jgi:protocatechuate 3,4-dioxygenase alpha subunit
MSRGTTPSQTVGPFFRIGLAHLYQSEAAPGGAGGRITLKGRVLDGDGAPVDDALLEFWQADANGNYAQAEGRGFARVATDDDGRFTLTTIKPGRVAGAGGACEAPHLLVAVFMRGLLKHLVTRVYFPEEASNAEDPVLQRVPAERRGTLVAKRAGDGTFAWNVILQGREETVFFDY